MKLFGFLILFVLTLPGIGQNLKLYEDKVYHFSIGIPEDWIQYQIPPDGEVELVVVRAGKSHNASLRESFNVNIIETGEKNFDKTYNEFVNSIDNADGFKIIAEGDTVINNRQYRYLVENHNNYLNGMAMTNYVLFTNKDGVVLVLTMVTVPEIFWNYKKLFDSIAFSLVY